MSKEYRLVHDKLKAAGLTEEASLAMLGNWAKESLFDPFRKQGDLSAAAIPSHQYTEDVMSGAISRERFARDQIGYGYAQWTYYNFDTGRGRKLNLYDFWKKSGVRLDDPEMQTDFAIWELRNEHSGVYAELKTSHNLYYCVDLICKKFEQPAFNNVQDRYEAALEIKAILAKEEPKEEPKPIEEKPIEADSPETPYWPPRGARGGRDDPGLCKGMMGADVDYLQGCLAAHGYPRNDVCGEFGVGTEESLKKYQEKKGLGADGIAGPMSWKSLNEM